MLILLINILQMSLMLTHHCVTLKGLTQHSTNTQYYSGLLVKRWSAVAMTISHIIYINIYVYTYIYIIIYVYTYAGNDYCCRLWSKYLQYNWCALLSFAACICDCLFKVLFCCMLMQTSSGITQCNVSEWLGNIYTTFVVLWLYGT